MVGSGAGKSDVIRGVFMLSLESLAGVEVLRSESTLVLASLVVSFSVVVGALETTGLSGFVTSNESSLFVSFVFVGKTLVRMSRDYANRSEQLENNQFTRYGIASGCKIFTAVAICQLVDSGKLSFDSRLKDCVDFQCSSFDDKVTIHHLLTHTSGVPDYFDEEVMGDFEALWRDTPMYNVRRLQDFLPLFQDRPMKFDPGTRFSYNNAGYILLGLIVEAATQQSFSDYVQDNVFSCPDQTQVVLCFHRVQWRACGTTLHIPCPSSVQPLPSKSTSHVHRISLTTPPGGCLTELEYRPAVLLGFLQYLCPEPDLRICHSTLDIHWIMVLYALAPSLHESTRYLGIVRIAHFGPLPEDAGRMLLCSTGTDLPHGIVKESGHKMSYFTE